mgnify:CR=1 FL=1
MHAIWYYIRNITHIVDDHYDHERPSRLEDHCCCREPIRVHITLKNPFISVLNRKLLITLIRKRDGKWIFDWKRRRLKLLIWSQSTSRAVEEELWLLSSDIDLSSNFFMNKPQHILGKVVLAGAKTKVNNSKSDWQAQHSSLERWVKLHCVFLQYCFKNKFENNSFIIIDPEIFLRKNFVFNSVYQPDHHQTLTSYDVECHNQLCEVSGMDAKNILKYS